MKNIFIDTNVIIDFLSDRKPFSEDAAILFQLAKEKKINVYVAAISFNNTYYILRQATSNKRALKLIDEFEEYVYVQETNRDILKKALRSDFNDFEDAIQYYSAIQLGEIDILTTRNLKDFKKSEIPVLSPSTTVKILLKDM
ncbi:MAG: hypothetical protein DRJ10_20175 [Bacteroidetes bacterium]|nr:MAG: hypothetical protein DRJ10_20175 [Bacteroidota bacterium]